MKAVLCELQRLVRRNFLASVLTSEAARKAAAASCPCPRHVAARRRKSKAVRR